MKGRRRGWFVVLLTFCLLIPGTMTGPVSADGKKSNKGTELILLQNVPEADRTIKGDTVQMEVLRVYKDGHFKKVEENLKWSSNNKRVAEVDEHGKVTWHGKPGRAWITVRSGKDQDRIAVHFKRKKHKGQSEVTPVLMKQKGKKYDIVRNAIDKMTMEEKVGQMLMPDFRTWKGKNVTEMNAEIGQMVKQYHLGGVILFRENVVTTEQTTTLVDDYQSSSEKFGLLMTIDQEGGIVTRLQSGTDMPGNMALGAARSEELAQNVGNAIGEELAALGFNVNFAPVMDVNNNPDNPVIGVRSFGGDPRLVGTMGTAYMRGLQQAGVAATAKHFPGHGDTAVDSHLGLPEVPHDLDRLKEVELYPFQQAMDAGIDAIMTAHVTFPKIDDTEVISQKDGTPIALPATLSEKVLTGLIREEMGYEGIVVTDALNMKAISDHFGPVDSVIRAINAGTDIVLMPVGLEEVAGGIYEAVETGEIKEETIEDSARRILTLKVKRGIIPSENPKSLEEKVQYAEEIVGSEAHKQVEKEAAEKSITMVKNDGVLPVTPEEEEEVLVIGNTFIDLLGDAVRERHGATTVLSTSSAELTEGQLEMVKKADYIIFGTYTYNVATRSADHPQMKLIHEVMDASEAPVISIGIRNPYDIMSYAGVDAYLAQYGFKAASFKASAATIFGENSPQGKLPVTIPDEDGSVMYEYGTGLTY